MSPSRTSIRLSLCVAVALAAACASAKVHDPRMSEGVPYQIRPGVAWVENFAVPAEMMGEDPEVRERAEMVMKAVTRATIDTLVASGYSAREAPSPDERASDTPPLGAVLVQGHFDEIDEGNAFGRILVGFGLGASKLNSSVELDLLSNGASQRLFQCDVHAKGSKMPGLIVPIGLASEIGLLINGVMKGVGELKGPLAGDARRTGEAIGHRLAAVFRALEWEGG